MKTKTIQLSVATGSPGGHVPGHPYHDVKVTVNRKINGRWLVTILETWGSNRGHDEEIGRRQVIGREATLEKTLEQARQLGLRVGMKKALLEQSISLAASEAKEKVKANRN